MNKYAVLLITLVLTGTVFLNGCGGGGAKVNSQITTTTMGQELEDLESAYKKGLLTESEYKEQRKAILKRYK